MNLQWKAASGYVQGIGHVENNEPCQDRAIHIHDEDLHGIVLADGAGSCRLSEKGAELVVQAFSQYSKDKFDEWSASENPALLIEEFLLQLIDEEVAKHEQADRMDFSCTVLFVLVKNNQFLAGHIGDGVIFQRINNELSVLSHPENGRYINETYFITMAPLNEHFRIYKGTIEKYMDFMLMSDGAATSFYIQSERKIEEKNTMILFNHLVENNDQLFMEELPALLDMVKENTTDDCAITLMTSHTIDMIDAFEDSTVESESDSKIEKQGTVISEGASVKEQSSVLSDVGEEIEEESNSNDQQEEVLLNTISIENFQLDLPENDEDLEGLKDESLMFDGNEEDLAPEFEDEDHHDYEAEFEYEEDSNFEDIEEKDEQEELPEYIEEENDQEDLPEYMEEEDVEDELPEYIEEEEDQEDLPEYTDQEEESTHGELAIDVNENHLDSSAEVENKENEKVSPSVVKEDISFETEVEEDVENQVTSYEIQEENIQESIPEQKEQSSPIDVSNIELETSESSPITIEKEKLSEETEKVDVVKNKP